MMAKLVKRVEVLTFELGNQDNDLVKHRQQMEADGWVLEKYDLEEATYSKVHSVDQLTQEG